MANDMMPEPNGEVTRLLGALREGDNEASDRLIALVYAELRRLAGSYMQRERKDHTLQATALVHEAYMRMVGSQAAPENRAHFFGIAANTMRQVLLDHARRHRAAKRGGEGTHKVDLEAHLMISEGALDDVIAIDDALEQLAAIDPRLTRLIELRFFGGLSVEEAAELLGISMITAKRDWKSAKAWLHRYLATAKSG